MVKLSMINLYVCKSAKDTIWYSDCNIHIIDINILY